MGAENAVMKEERPEGEGSSISGTLKEVPNLDFILDIPLEVSVELGRARMLINDLLQLGQGSVIELTKLAGEPAEIYVNQKLIARGEVVVINEKLGVRMTDIISPAERVKQLGV
jgi:flagellar motor switch protein FliN